MKFQSLHFNIYIYMGFYYKFNKIFHAASIKYAVNPIYISFMNI